jgi:hypothetical protein
MGTKYRVPPDHPTTRHEVLGLFEPGAVLEFSTDEDNAIAEECVEQGVLQDADDGEAEAPHEAEETAASGEAERPPQDTEEEGESGGQEPHA